MQLIRTVTGAKVEFIFVRGWTTVFDPRVMRCVPVNEACSAMTREDERDVGGLGAGGIVDCRFEEDILVDRMIENRYLDRHRLDLMEVNEGRVSL